MSEKFDKELIAPCGMNCGIWLGFFGYTVSGKKRKMKCTGCRPTDKSCAFVKKNCKKLLNKEIEYCFECNVFPCEKLKNIDERYRRKYEMSMIDNLNYIQKNGIDDFLKKERQRWKCPKCGGVICVHDKRCYSCEV